MDHAPSPALPMAGYHLQTRFVRNSAVGKDVKIYGQDLKNQIFAGDFEYTTASASTGVVAQESTQAH